MPQHKSAAKRVRQSEKRRAQNRVHRSKMRTLIKKLYTEQDKSVAVEQLNEIKSMLDRLSAKGILHGNTAANYKSALEKRVSAL